MTQPTPDAEIVMVDANGEVTEDRSKAVRGEILEQLPDGSTRSTLFEISAASPGDRG